MPARLLFSESKDESEDRKPPRISFIIFLSFLGLILISSCQESTLSLQDLKEYEGPSLVTFDMETVYSDSGKVKVVIKAPRRLQFQNGDESYPNGVTVDFYNPEGVRYSQLTADKARRISTDNHYIAYGNVVVRNTEQKQKLETDELNWKPSGKEIFTEKPVKITTETEILKGKGLVASEDFSSYKIT
ncbi:MAG: LPS export ABC transporter periplasmic protein LptC, partial [Bacteroidota bacterium]